MPGAAEPALDAAVSRAPAVQLGTRSGALPIPLADGTSPAADGVLQGSAPVAGLTAPVTVSVHALLAHVPTVVG